MQPLLWHHPFSGDNDMNTLESKPPANAFAQVSAFLTKRFLGFFLIAAIIPSYMYLS